MHFAFPSFKVYHKQNENVISHTLPADLGDRNGRENIMNRVCRSRGVYTLIEVRAVNVRISKPVENFCKSYLSQTEDIPGSRISTHGDKCF